MSGDEELGRLLGDMAGDQPERVALRLATAMSVDYASQSADVLLPDGSVVTAVTAGQLPLVAEPVWVLVVGEVAVTVGRPVKPPMGVVADAAVNGLVPVTGDDGLTYTVGFPTTYTPAAGHRVLLYWEAGGHIIARVDTSNPTPAPPYIPTQTIQKTQTFDPIDSGSYRDGWSGMNTDVYVGDAYQAAGWFYGTQIADSIPDSARIVSVRTYLESTQSSDAPTITLGLHTLTSKGDGQMVVDSAVDIGAMADGFAGDVDLPTSWGDLLKTGDRRGIGTAAPGYRRLSGAPTAGALTISWEE